MHNNMSNKVDIRENLPTDKKSLEDLYSAAFPDEDLIPLLRELLSEKNNVFSFFATNNGVLVGHIVFTICSITGRNEKVSLLGPVAVSPHIQRQGIGSTLIQEGLNRLKNDEVTQIYVLGDPAYYCRFGFKPDSNVKPPYDLPQKWQTAWQSVSLHNIKSAFEGTLSVPKPWRQPTLWAP